MIQHVNVTQLHLIVTYFVLYLHMYLAFLELLKFFLLTFSEIESI